MTAAAAVILNLKCGNDESEIPRSQQIACALGFLYARHPQVHSFLTGNGCAHLLQQHALGTALQLEGAALTHGALFSLGGLGLLLSWSM